MYLYEIVVERWCLFTPTILIRTILDEAWCLLIRTILIQTILDEGWCLLIRCLFIRTISTHIENNQMKNGLEVNKLLITRHKQTEETDHMKLPNQNNLERQTI